MVGEVSDICTSTAEEKTPLTKFLRVEAGLLLFRSFPHVRNNWATYVYAEPDRGVTERIAALQSELCAALSLEPVDTPHLRWVVPGRRHAKFCCFYLKWQLIETHPQPYKSRDGAAPLDTPFRRRSPEVCDGRIVFPRRPLRV